jgi:hypothetical protein
MTAAMTGAKTAAKLTTSKASERPLYRLTLRPERGVDAERALRRLLKIALRTFGLRCVAIEEVQP